MAEVEDDYDDESCSSSEDLPHERLDRMEFDRRDLDAMAVKAATQALQNPMASEVNVLSVPPSKTIAMSPRTPIAATEQIPNVRFPRATSVTAVPQCKVVYVDLISRCKFSL
eukprot:CAMPEP_0178904960 /NCGR_PEP_ID=MMETSP0786-20121207/5987_1 /TAXON_ID=186022 /ORGANISM="Thalassionema frauenfeldii, Strain CCMP 1798" /LENGTH=111 /DNA_ID=CAMNT_0020576469 /DNA_START=424 /DNA_END=759 /DNA_ORIENTATION=+